MSGITPLLPLGFGDEPGYVLIDKLEDLVKQNLKNLFLTNPGERIMDLDFGIGLKQYLFEQSVAATYDSLEARSVQQVEKYMPFVEIDAVNVAPDDSDSAVVYVEVEYEIIPLRKKSTLDLTLQSVRSS